ncbi:hypothetical protein PG2006B_0127 [Bifidobacterium animalis subsp. animalis]|nr:hypothetical protein PG2006B_0127 [Bifidobacterium animalis subsp. animalis]
MRVRGTLRMNLRSASSIAVRVRDAPNAPRCAQRPFFAQSHDSTDRQHPSTVKTYSPARSDRQRSSRNPNLPPIPYQLPASSLPAPCQLPASSLPATIFIGHSAHDSTIQPPSDTPQRPKRATRHTAATGGTPKPQSAANSATNLPNRYLHRPLRAPQHNPATERHSPTAKTRNPAQNSQQGTTQHPSSLTATIPVGHSAHDSTIRPPNNAPQRPKRATRHRMATEPHSPMAEICNPTQRGRGAARQTAGHCRNAVAGERNPHIQSIVVVKPVRYRRRQHTERKMRRRTWSACATSRNGRVSQ